MWGAGSWPMNSQMGLMILGYFPLSRSVHSNHFPCAWNSLAYLAAQDLSSRYWPWFFDIRSLFQSRMLDNILVLIAAEVCVPRLTHIITEIVQPGRHESGFRQWASSTDAKVCICQKYHYFQTPYGTVTPDKQFIRRKSNVTCLVLNWRSWSIVRFLLKKEKSRTCYNWVAYASMTRLQRYKSLS